MEFTLGKRPHTIDLNNNPLFILLVEEGLNELVNIIQVLPEKQKEAVSNYLEQDKAFKGNLGQFATISLSHDKGSSILLLLGIGKKSKLQALQCQRIGSDIAFKLNEMKRARGAIYLSLHNVTDSLDEAEIASNIYLGIKLRNYSFNKYFRAKAEEHKLFLQSVDIYVSDAALPAATHRIKQSEIVGEGVNFTRDLANEVPNVLYPESFAERCKELTSLGLKVTVLEQEEMAKLGMNALLGVAQGSAHPPRLVALEWQGDDKSNEFPLALIGKGVTFDSGGLNLKSTSGMADMKYDMSGAAVVAGVMSILAKRRANVNVVGILGLVENMPSDTAQRPSDIVISMSGISIEIDNTDAEGRLVLADALDYVQNRYNPKTMIDLATLTGAIVVALGDVHAGLFSNNEGLAQQLLAAGQRTGDLLWQLPLSDHYDKYIDSDVADVRNSTGGSHRGGGSITAAQFLQRFVKDPNCRWAHLDIAGMSHNKSSTVLHPRGGSGFGVKLLEDFIKHNYEGK